MSSPVVYHGTPMTPRAALNAVLPGRAACVSFFRPDDLEAVLAVCPQVMFRPRSLFLLDAGHACGAGVGRSRPSPLVERLLRLAGTDTILSGPMGDHTGQSSSAIPTQRRASERLAVWRSRRAGLAHGRVDRTTGEALRAIWADKRSLFATLANSNEEWILFLKNQLPAKGIERNKRPTMAMVAKVAGMSPITVSRALRGSELVRPQVRRHIVQIAAQMGYRLNVSARALRTRESRTIAVVIDQISDGSNRLGDPLTLSIIGGLLESLTPAGYATLLTTHEHFGSAAAINADGAVVLGQGEGARRVMEMAELDLPVVAWGEPFQGASTKVVGSDNAMGGRLAAKHLVKRGATRILFLGDTRHPEIKARVEGFRDALPRTKVRLVGISACPFSALGGANAVRQALDAGTEFDAVFAASDLIAAGACESLAASGIRVPEDVAVVGFDDSPIALAHRPPISSIRQNGTEGGRALGALIVGLVRGEVGAPVHRLAVELVPRESSRAIRRHSKM